MSRTAWPLSEKWVVYNRDFYLVPAFDATTGEPVFRRRRAVPYSVGDPHPWRAVSPHLHVMRDFGTHAEAFEFADTAARDPEGELRGEVGT